MPVEVLDETEQAAPLAAAATAVAEAILGCLGRADDELGVLLVSDARMQELNREWRGKDRPTDVLSFSQVEAGDGGVFVPGSAGSGPAMLGDVVVSVDTLARQAEEGGWKAEEELARLLLHGILHLLGYDHETGEDDARRMRAEEGRIVALLVDRGIACAWEEETA